MQLADHVAIITGSARGIGRATALSLAREGANIVVADINAAGAQDAAAEIENLGQRKYLLYTLMWRITRRYRPWYNAPWKRLVALISW